jgi:hypothetical protein
MISLEKNATSVLIYQYLEGNSSFCACVKLTQDCNNTACNSNYKLILINAIEFIQKNIASESISPEEEAMWRDELLKWLTKYSFCQ